MVLEKLANGPVKPTSISQICFRARLAQSQLTFLISNGFKKLKVRYSMFEAFQKVKVSKFGNAAPALFLLPRFYAARRFTFVLANLHDYHSTPSVKVKH